MKINDFHKQFILLAIVQGIALYAGLWIHEQFTISTAQWKANDNSFVSELSDQSESNPIEASHLLESMVISRYFTFSWMFLLLGIITFLLLSKIHMEHSMRVVCSNEQSVLKSKELVRTRDAIIFGLAKLAESRDSETGYHLERISLYSTILANAMRHEPEFSKQITPSFIKLIGLSSALHDIGKVGVEDSILLKPGQLTKSERFNMQLHAKVGGDCIQEIESRLGNCNFLEMAREIAYYHHERWDGEGYPDGLMEENIPLAARIVAVADVYDALSVKRVYKEQYSHEKCVDMIKAESGTQFDPRIVNVFLKVEDEFRKIAEQFEEKTGQEIVKPKTQPQLAEKLMKMTSEQENMLRKVLSVSESNTDNTVSSTL